LQASPSHPAGRVFDSIPSSNLAWGATAANAAVETRQYTMEVFIVFLMVLLL
jgi:hypothetical protein